MSSMSRYCKAYPVERLREFSGWAAEVGAGECIPGEPLFVHEDFAVTRGIYRDDEVVYEGGSPAWRAFCKDELGLEPRTGQASASGDAAGR